MKMPPDGNAPTRCLHLLPLKVVGQLSGRKGCRLGLGTFRRFLHSLKGERSACDRLASRQTTRLASLRYLASQVHLQEIHFLLRPLLSDANDDMVFEVAFAAVGS
jgi:hypothetical protein